MLLWDDAMPLRSDTVEIQPVLFAARRVDLESRLSASDRITKTHVFHDRAAPHLCSSMIGYYQKNPSVVVPSRPAVLQLHSLQENEAPNTPLDSPISSTPLIDHRPRGGMNMLLPERTTPPAAVARKVTRRSKKWGRGGPSMTAALASRAVPLRARSAEAVAQQPRRRGVVDGRRRVHGVVPHVLPVGRISQQFSIYFSFLFFGFGAFA